MPLADPTYIGQVASVTGAIVRVRLREDMPSTLVASSHRHELVRGVGPPLIGLPPYSPELNPARAQSGQSSIRPELNPARAQSGQSSIRRSGYSRRRGGGSRGRCARAWRIRSRRTELESNPDRTRIEPRPCAGACRLGLDRGRYPETPRALCGVIRTIWRDSIYSG